MAIGTLLGVGLGIAGAGAVAQGVGSAVGASQQAAAARSAQEMARRAGQEGRDILQRSLGESLSAADRGFSSGEATLTRADEMLQGGQQQFADQFQQERQVGSQALGRLQQALLGGDMSAVATDPGFQFRQEQGNKAIERAAAAAGSFGSGGNLKDFSRFNQGLASQEFGNAIGRLSGLAGIGSQANANLANLQAGLLGQRANILGQQSQLGVNRGLTASQLRQQNATNQANSLTNQASTVGGLELQRANAIAGGAQGVGNAITGFGQNALLAGALGGFGGGAARPPLAAPGNAGSLIGRF